MVVCVIAVSAYTLCITYSNECGWWGEILQVVRLCLSTRAKPLTKVNFAHFHPNNSSFFVGREFLKHSSEEELLKTVSLQRGSQTEKFTFVSPTTVKSSPTKRLVNKCLGNK